MEKIIKTTTIVLFATLLAVFIYNNFKLVTVSRELAGSALLGQYKENDVLLVWKRAYNYSKPKFGDIVVIDKTLHEEGQEQGSTFEKVISTRMGYTKIIDCLSDDVDNVKSSDIKGKIVLKVFPFGNG